MEMELDIRIGVVGSPNSGKTTLFNVLTGSRQKTGNYAGVTVERKEGVLRLPNGHCAKLVDLPGAYSLDARTPDEEITAHIIAGLRADERKPDFLVAVSDSTNLEVNLYFVLQLIERGLPLILALTMSDLARKQGLEIDTKKLEQALGVPVVIVSARNGNGLPELSTKILEFCDVPKLSPGSRSDSRPRRSGAGDNLGASPQAVTLSKSSPQEIVARYDRIEKLIDACVTTQRERRQETTRKLDKVLLHRFWGPVILIAALAIMFQSIFSFAKFPMDLLQHGVDVLSVFLRHVIPDGIVQSLLVDGIVAGVGAVVVFLPQIILLFAFIIAFEDSGYLARATFILDRFMSAIGLNGRAFIPLLSSFACAIPGIMATRTIESKRDRLITILIAPLMTCSARLPVYALLIAAFIPHKSILGFLNLQGLTLFALYVGGIFFAVAVAFILRHTLYRGENSKFVLELPTYKAPSVRNLLMGLWDRSVIFLTRAGTIILATSIVLWALTNFPKHAAPQEIANQGTAATAAFQLQHSYAGDLGRFIEPVIRPLGFDWRIGIGIISSFAAREVLVSTLSTVFAVQGAGAEQELSKRLASDAVFVMPTVLALLVFYMLACQCTSTLAIVRRETNSYRWPAAMFVYMTLLAYAAAWATRLLAIALHL